MRQAVCREVRQAACREVHPAVCREVHPAVCREVPRAELRADAIGSVEKARRLLAVLYLAIL